MNDFIQEFIEKAKMQASDVRDEVYVVPVNLIPFGMLDAYTRGIEDALGKVPNIGITTVENVGEEIVVESFREHTIKNIKTLLPNQENT